MSTLNHETESGMESLRPKAKKDSRQLASLATLERERKSPAPSAAESKKPSESKTRRSKRGSQPSMDQSGHRPSLGHRQNSVSESMEPSNIRRTNSEARSESITSGHDAPDSSVRYTPTTGRISRAKKGLPVHVCNQCETPRVFSRAEHLRRHQLSHKQPLWPCTFEDCDKTFHRPDLLARHINRHETQGEIPYRPGDNQSLVSSSSTGSPSPSLKVEAPMMVDGSPAYRTSEGLQVSSQPYPNTESTTTSVPYGDKSNSLLPSDSNDHSSVPSEPSGVRPTHRGPIIIAAQETADVGSRPTYQERAIQSNTSGNSLQTLDHGSFVDNYQDFSNPGSETELHVQHLSVRVPDADVPALTHTNSSPWTPTDSTWSTPSDISRQGAHWPRDRSASIIANTGWIEHPVTVSPRFSNGAIQNARSSALEIVVDRYESPPFAPAHLSPPMVSYHGVSHSESGFTGEFLGLESLSRSMKFEAEPYTGIPRLSRLARPSNEGRQDTLVNVEDSTASQMIYNSYVDDEKLNLYVSSFRLHVEPVFPVLHRARPYGHYLDKVLNNGIAALGSQFHNYPEDRQNGFQLHETCRKMLTLSTEWSTEEMQCIFIIELFGRFRTPKVVRHPSHQFRLLYDKLLDDQLLQGDAKNLFTRLNPQEIITYVLNQSTGDATQISDQFFDDIWRQWIDYETRQRLRSACFIFDTHQAMYYGQDRERPEVNSDSIFLAVQCPETLWTACSGAEWFGRLHQMNYQGNSLVQPLNISVEQAKILLPSTRFLVLSCLMARLPRKETILTSAAGSALYDETYVHIENLCPQLLISHAYLAFYHTPLHDLLAHTGDSWLFGRKITSATEMTAINHRVTKWLRSPLARHATWHACHVIRLYLSQPLSLAPNHSATYLNICDYWAVYTASIICLVFGRSSQQHRQFQQQPNRAPAAANPMSTSSSSSFSSLNSLNNAASRGEVNDMRAAALRYTDEMLSVDPSELSTVRVRSDTTAMLTAVRWYLGIELSEGESQCAMLVDACNVLDRILEGGK